MRNTRIFLIAWLSLWLPVLSSLSATTVTGLKVEYQTNPLGIDVSQINVKATTEEGLGFTGNKEGISSQAVCLLNTPYGLYSEEVGKPACSGCGGCPKQ